MKRKAISLVMAIALLTTGCFGGYKKPTGIGKPTNSSTVQVGDSTDNKEDEVITTPQTETAAPETEAASPETTVPETIAPETTTPETTVQPETTAPETTIPETTVPETTAPETTVPETTTTVQTEPPTPQWKEEAVNETFYITVDCYERTGAYIGAPAGAVLKKSSQVKVVAKTDTDYYKLENGRFVHKDYVSKTKPAEPEATDFKTLINKAKLKPMRTNNEVLDKQVDDILARIITPEMTNYEKVQAIYDYVIANSTYGGGIIYWNEMMSFMGNRIYTNQSDIEMVYMSHVILDTGVGVCDNYAAAFTVLTRAIGVESYWVGGKVAYSGGGYVGHRWNNIKVGGKWFEFDAQIEDKYDERNGYTSYSFWGKPRGANSIYIYPEDLSTIEENFGAFEYVEY